MNTPRNATRQLLATHPVLMAASVGRSVSFYEALGFEVAFVDDGKSPKYVGLRRDEVEIHLQWNELPPTGNDDRPVYRFLTQDVDTLYEEFRARSPGSLADSTTTPWHAPANTPWRTREFHLHDPSGNSLQFYQPSPEPSRSAA